MSVDFEPARLGGRRRRVDPVLVGVAVVGIALVAAVVKPWEAIPPAPAPSIAVVTPSIAPSPSPSPTPTARPTLPPAALPPSWDDIASVVTAHDAWGVRAILRGSRGTDDAPAPGRYLEDWAPTRTASDGRETAIVERDDGSVVGLGVTVPRAEIAQDVRIWRVRADDRLEWVDARQIASGPVGDQFLYLQPGPSGSVYQAWEPGEYRIDVLVEGGIRRISVGVTGRFGVVPAPHQPPSAPSRVVAAAASDPSGVRVGMFATVDGVGVPLAAEIGRPLDEVDAWLATKGEGPSAPTVAAAYLPRATGLGVMLTTRASVQLAVLSRLAPTPLYPVPPARGGISSTQGQVPFILFGARDGDAMAPGVYAISVSWTDETGLHAGTWHVELLPGPPPSR